MVIDGVLEKFGDVALDWKDFHPDEIHMCARKWNYWCAWKVCSFFYVGQWRVTKTTIRFVRRHRYTRQLVFYVCLILGIYLTLNQVLRKPTWSACRIKIFQDTIVPPFRHVALHGSWRRVLETLIRIFYTWRYITIIGMPVCCMHIQHIFEPRERILYKK